MQSPVLVSVALYVAACCLPALEFRNTTNADDVMWGLRALAVGWSGIFAGVMAWYANPFWLLGNVTRTTLIRLLPGCYV